MNKFADVIERLKERAGGIDRDEKRPPQPNNKSSSVDKKAEPNLRLPYSSNPKRIGERWS